MSVRYNSLVGDKVIYFLESFDFAARGNPFHESGAPVKGVV